MNRYKEKYHFLKYNKKENSNIMAKIKFISSRKSSPLKGLTTLILLISVILLCPLASKSQESAQPSVQEKIKHEVKVTLKLIQVYVTDKKGNPTTDLSKEDFEVFDNEERKFVTDFEKHLQSFALQISEEEKEQQMPRQNLLTTEKLTRKFFFLFDFVFNNKKGLRKTREAALDFMDKIVQPEDEVGIITYSLEGGLNIREFLTRDHVRIRKFIESIGLNRYQSSVENLEIRYWSDTNKENLLDVTEQGYVGAGMFSSDDPNQPGYLGSDEMKRAAMTGENKVQAITFLREMTKLSQALGYVPGIKHILFFSAGIPYSLIYGIQVADPSRGGWRQDWGQTQIQHYLDDMQKQVTHSNLVFYAFDTEDPTTRLNLDQRLTGILTLGKIADFSGGKYFGNVNNFPRALDDVQKMTGCYYVLGYYVDEKWDGQFHEIKVRVSRPGLKVYSQRGYFNPKPFKELSALEKQLHLVDLCLSEKPILQTPLELKSGGFSYFIGGKENLILWAGLLKEELSKLAGNKMELLYVIFDAGNNLVKMDRQKLKLSSLPESEQVYFSVPFDLPPGNYKCRVVVRNLESGQSALGSAEVGIREEIKNGLSLGQPLVLIPSSSINYHNFASSMPLSTRNYKLQPPQLSAGTEELYLLLSCGFSEIKNPDLELKGILLRTERDQTVNIPVVLEPLDTRKETDHQTYIVRIKTEPLPAGSFLLYIHAVDKASGLRSTRSLALLVKS